MPRARIIRIGNSRGVRIPKPLLADAGLEDEVELVVTSAGLLIRPSPHPRSGWKDAALSVHERGEDGLLDESAPTRFDETEWEWD